MITYYVANTRYYEFESNEQEYKNYKYWCIEYRNENGQLHREDGPAREYSSGKKWWFKNGKKHREDGPAVEFPDGRKEYWYNNEYVSVKTDKEFKKYIKMKVFI
jgi:hypothetical protein